MIKSFLRGFFASFLLLSMMASASAQTKTWGHSLYQGVGLSNKLNDEDKQTVALPSDTPSAIPSLPDGLSRRVWPCV